MRGTSTTEDWRKANSIAQVPHAGKIVVSGALSTVTDAAAKATIKSLLAALVQAGLVVDNTT